MMSISTTPVPYIKAENETAIIPRPDYKWDTDEVWRFCGKKGPSHICEESFVVKVGDDDGANVFSKLFKIVRWQLMPELL